MLYFKKHIVLILKIIYFVLEIASVLKRSCCFSMKIFFISIKYNFLWHHEFLIIFIHLSLYLQQLHLHKGYFILWRLWDEPWLIQKRTLWGFIVIDFPTWKIILTLYCCLSSLFVKHTSVDCICLWKYGDVQT